MAPSRPILPALLALALPAEAHRFPGFVARDVACGPCPAIAPTVTVTAPIPPPPPVRTVTVTAPGPSFAPPEIQTVTVTQSGPGHGGPPGPNWGGYPFSPPPPPPAQPRTVTVTAAAPPLPLTTLWETVYINHSPSASTLTLTHTETTTPSRAWPSHPADDPLTVSFSRPYPHLDPPTTVTATITEPAPAAEHTLPPWGPSNILSGSDWYDPGTPTWTHPAPSQGPHGPPGWVWGGCDGQGGNCAGEEEKPTVWDVEAPTVTPTGWGEDCTVSTAMVTVFNTLTQTVHPSAVAAPVATSEAEAGWPSLEEIKAWGVGEEDGPDGDGAFNAGRGY